MLTYLLTLNLFCHSLWHLFYLSYLLFIIYVIYAPSMHIHSIYVRRVQLLGSLVGLFSLLVTLKSNQIKSSHTLTAIRHA